MAGLDLKERRGEAPDEGGGDGWWGGGGETLPRPHTCPGGPAVEEGSHLICLGGRGLMGGAQLPGMPQQRKRVMPAGGGVELDQQSPNWDSSRRGLHGRVL